MNKLPGFLALGLMGSLGAPLYASHPTYDRIYVFGDSYSDIGAGYIDGNGPTAVAYLAEAMKLPFTHARDPQANRESIDFAVSGAQTGEGKGETIGSAILGVGMRVQVEDFAQRVHAGAITFNPATTLFFFAGGLNDQHLPTEETVANLTREIELLLGLGGRHFTVALLPTRIPAFSAVGKRLNPAYAAFVPPLAARLGIALTLNQWGPDFDEVMAHPARYGITNTTDACAGRALFGQDPTPHGDPSKYFYYHADHPSTATHRIVGQMLFRELGSVSRP
jgi:phospholipase/lecithinase/hemolysin